MRGTDPIVSEYTKLAPRYDRKWSFYIDASTAQTLAHLPLAFSGRLLDVGCGTGALLQRLVQARKGGELFGIDPVPAMLEEARRKVGDKAALREGRAEQIPFDDGFFNIVVSCNMFHFVREPMVALREMKRVVAPGGLLIITDWCDDYLACRICDRWLRIFSGAHFKVYRESECVELLKATGFADVKSQRFKITWLWGLMTATGIKG